MLAPGELASKFSTPDEHYPGLFHAVQMGDVFSDSKTFPDCTPLRDPQSIENAFLRESQDPSFSIRQFVESNFTLPRVVGGTYVRNPDHTMQQHINAVWPHLTFQTQESSGSLFGLPKRYIKPGGRFREFYGNHDGPAAAIGLAVQGHWDLVEEMADNCAYMLNELGVNPNGNRTYYFSRAQRPMFQLLVELVGYYRGREATLRKYLPALQTEHDFWMDGKDRVTESDPAYRRVVRMRDGSILNRYYDDKDTPRPEAYREDIESGIKAGVINLTPDQAKDYQQYLKAIAVDPTRVSKFNRDMRGGAEAAKDYCGEYFANGKTRETICTTDMIPVDLNCQLKRHEDLLSEAYAAAGNVQKAAELAIDARNRGRAINKFCYDPKKSFYFVYNYATEKPHPIGALGGGGYPLYAHIVPRSEVPRVGRSLRQNFLTPAGFLETLDESDEQWGGGKHKERERQNIWTIDNYIADSGLWANGLYGLAVRARNNMVRTGQRTYRKHGITPEKYCATGEDPGTGGEYDVIEEGFALNNGPMMGLVACAFTGRAFERIAERAKHKRHSAEHMAATALGHGLVEKRS